MSATGSHRNEGFPYALDNGAWTSFQRGTDFDELLFRKALRKMGANADWVVVPDIVTAGRDSLAFSLRWLNEVLSQTQLALFAVQDGIKPIDVESYLGKRVGLFVGGSTGWKLETIPQWCNLGRRIGCWVHIGRVNTKKRISFCAMHGATSFDGSSVTKFPKTLPRLEAARNQLGLQLWEA